MAVTAVWAVGVFVPNVLLDTNYGYLNDKPGSASILDPLGRPGHADHLVNVGVGMTWRKRQSSSSVPEVRCAPLTSAW